jgi:hypothetical protein
VMRAGVSLARSASSVWVSDDARVEEFLEVVGECQKPGHARNAAAWPRRLGPLAQDERVGRRGHVGRDAQHDA